MTSTTEKPTARTYGHWRRPTSAGLLHLGTFGTVALLAGLIVTVVIMMTGHLAVAVGFFAVLAGLLLLTVIRDQHGRSVLARTATAWNWRQARSSGADRYRSGPAGGTPWGTHQLPGLAASSRLWEFRDSTGADFAVLHLPSVGHFTVAFVCEPDGAALVDADQVDSWVADWGHWLATLGEEPGIVQVAVTVESAPDTGTRLAREVEEAMSPAAPDFARAMLEEVVQTYPAGAAVVRAYVAVTFTAANRPGGPRRKPREVGRDLASRLPGLGQALSSTGAGAARPMSGQELCETVRVAFDPAAARLVEEARITGEDAGMDWSDVGPTGTKAEWDAYRHDSGISVTWQMSSAPRGVVQSKVLTRLLAPHRDIARKRVTWLYRPIDAARAAAIVEADLRNATFNNTSANRVTARDQVSEQAARITAAEEAAGAGLVNFGALVTATVLDPAKLPDARAAVDNLSATARLRLRVVHGGQDTAFLAALPLGLVLTSHVRVPTEIRGKWN